MSSSDIYIRQHEPPPPPGAAVLLAFPKSGRTWVRYMLDQLGADFHVSHGGAAHIAKQPFEAVLCGPAVYRACRVLFLLRDPRDTAVSGFFQATRRKRFYEGDMAAFLRDPLHGLEKIIRFNLLWSRAGETISDFEVIRYERMRRDAHEEFARAARFVLERDSDEAAVEAAVEAGKYDNMRRVERSGEGQRLYGAGLRPRDPADPDSYKVRRGVVGGWRDYFSDADTAYAEELFDEHSYRSLLADGGAA
ncbi:MAG: sulfotransferase domain-containing protein [Parasphingopyxis sp.]|uniref:sulfotransferase domain-containing protein n=1 Tax=Parasphingopyxis sp. TaxID=1920299 RepID=UPI0026150F1B|nr:sulfotransferase domain-containing protein [uncultured Parasphingopyxis sp.]